MASWADPRVVTIACTMDDHRNCSGLCRHGNGRIAGACQCSCHKGEEKK